MLKQSRLVTDFCWLADEFGHMLFDLTVRILSWLAKVAGCSIVIAFVHGWKSSLEVEEAGHPVADSIPPAIDLLVSSTAWVTSKCFDAQLLAPTGALKVMVVYYISAAVSFSDFQSVHWRNWCYKCHSKSLKQYQCNWCHKMQIDADWMSNVPMFKCSNVPMIQCSNVFFFSWGRKSLLSIGPLVH